MSHQAVIVAGARTAVGTAYKGSLSDTDALELATKAVAEAVSRSGIEPDRFDDVVLTLIHELRRRGGGTAVAAMCAGGGMASALVLDIPAPA
jgi:acetyl-CoA acetyltransferase